MNQQLKVRETLKNKPFRVIRGGGQSLLERIDKNSLTIIFYIIIMLCICALHCLDAGHYVDFFPINGTFQNYNPVRRLLDGQIPYRDFQDYLGMGHLYIGSFVTLIFGGNYQASLQAFSFLQFVGLALCSLVIAYSVFQRLDKALILSNLFLVCVLIQPAFFKNAIIGNDEMLTSVTTALGPGNSARFVRGMILPVVVILLNIGYELYKRIIPIIHNKSIVKNGIPYIGFGIVAGFSFIWSNDYGISCWLCIAVFSFWLCLSRERSLVISLIMMAVEMAMSVLSVAIFAEIFTLGHLQQWFTSTFGTGGYQGWYYNSGSGKSFYIFDVDFSYIMCMQAGLALYYLIKVFIHRGTVDSIRRYGMQGFMNMACFCAVNEYKVLSGGYAREVALSVLYLSLIYELINYIGASFHASDKKKCIAIISVIACVSWIIATCKDEFYFNVFTEKSGTYVEEMGGYLQARGDDLLSTDSFLSGEKVWATYASAQEVVSDCYQPSGTDYIIHVLGNQQRTDYLKKFNQGGFKYTATIREDFSDWECWIRQANWFFYRELYKNWHPVYSNSYELYWERNRDEEKNVVTDNIELNIADIDESTKKISVKYDDSINGFADVYLNYEVLAKPNHSSKFNIQKMLHVENTGTVYALGGYGVDGKYYESNYLRDVSREYIPIRVVNGYGEITITSSPSKSTSLNLIECNCEEIYTVTSNYANIDSISDDNYSVIIANTQHNIDAIVGVTSVIIQDKRYEVASIDNADNSITIHVNDPIEYHVGEENQLRFLR